MKKTLLLLSSIATLSFSSEVYKFNNIKFDGLTQISENIALESLKLEGKKEISEEQINNAIKNLYNFGYFKDIAVSKENDDIIFSFKEKPFIVSLSMTGYKTREEDLETLYNFMNIKKGTMFTKQKIENAKKALLEYIANEGYSNSVVEIETTYIDDSKVALNFEVNKGDEITIKNIKYIGAKALDESDFEEVIANKEEDCCFTWFFGMNEGEMNFEQLEYDSHRIREAYLKNGYLDVNVKPAFSKVDFNTNTADIEYYITEGEQYGINDVLIYVDENIANPKALKGELKLRKGKTFNIEKLRRDQTYIETQIADKGYAFTEVKYNIKKLEDNKVDLIYNIIPGDKVYINDVIISGNTRTLDRVIRRDVYLAPGDMFNLTDYKDSVGKLKRTGYFEDVEIQKQRVSSDKMNLIVKVSEAPTGNLIVGGGYGSYDGFMVNASVSDKNIFGSGLELGFSTDYSKRRSDFSVNLTNPAIRDSKYSGTVKVYNDESEVTTNYTDLGTKTVKEMGMLVGVGRGIGRHTRAGANYEISDADITYENSPADNDSYITSAITPYINYNNTDDYYLPRSGFNTGASVKYAGVGGDAEYIESNAYFKYYYGLEDMIDYDAIFRYKAKISNLYDNGNIPTGKSLYMGGVKSLRGYESYSFQPSNSDKPLDTSFTNAVELSFPLIPSAKMRWAVFYDFGYIKGDGTYTDASGNTKAEDFKRSGAGVLLSWNSPVGPIQFVFADALDAEAGDETSSFEFSLGGQF